MYKSNVQLNGNTKIGQDCVDPVSKREEIMNKAANEELLYGDNYDIEPIKPIDDPKCDNCGCELDRIKGSANFFKCDDCGITWEFLGHTGTKPVYVCIFDPSDVG